MAGPAGRGLSSLLRGRDLVRRDMTGLAEQSGLRHFEGRSFLGRHCQVTLASVAHGYRLAQRLEQEQFAEEWLRPCV